MDQNLCKFVSFLSFKSTNLRVLQFTVQLTSSPVKRWLWGSLDHHILLQTLLLTRGAESTAWGENSSTAFEAISHDPDGADRCDPPVQHQLLQRCCRKADP